jgi:hypothetical protein
MTKRKYVKKEKIVEVTPIDQQTFDSLLKVATMIKPPKKDSKPDTGK